MKELLKSIFKTTNFRYFGYHSTDNFHNVISFHIKHCGYFRGHFSFLVCFCRYYIREINQLFLTLFWSIFSNYVDILRYMYRYDVTGKIDVYSEKLLKDSVTTYIEYLEKSKDIQKAKEETLDFISKEYCEYIEDIIY